MLNQADTDLRRKYLTAIGIAMKLDPLIAEINASGLIAVTEKVRSLFETTKEKDRNELISTYVDEIEKIGQCLCGESRTLKFTIGSWTLALLCSENPPSNGYFKVVGGYVEKWTDGRVNFEKLLQNIL